MARSTSYWHGKGHATNFSQKVANASALVDDARDALQAVMEAEYPRNAHVYVVHHRGCFEGHVVGWDVYGTRVMVRNTLTGKVSKWWAAHVELQPHERAALVAKKG